VRGSANPTRYIVLSAHFDHLPPRGDTIFNGADDNASGTGALLALAHYFSRNQPRTSIVFAAFDAEERGLQGARAFVANPPVPLDSIVMNVNLDMVGRNDAGELYVTGTLHYPYLKAYIERVQPTAYVKLLMGHDQVPPGGRASDNWTSASDHGAFHSAGIPFLYFGVEDHPDYHRHTDEFERLQPGFYVRAMETVLDAILLLDADANIIRAQRR
jgi:Zn-dependent M28 family amino/carboxypeptidase